MPDFAYVARVPTGQQTTGTLTAASEREVMAVLDQRGLFPVRIEPAPKAAGSSFGFRRRIRSRYLSTLYAQLADLLHAGVPLLRSLEILERQTSVPAMAEILKDIHLRVADGTSLADAMGLDRSTLGRNLKLLESKGWVTLEEGEDSRNRLVSLTPAGREVLDRALRDWEVAQARMSERLGPENRAALMVLLDDLEYLD